MITTLRLENWMRFRGEHVLELGPMVYAVCAEFERDPERSNWGGKTQTLEAIAFAVTGWHRFRTEDEWINKDANTAAVGLAIDHDFVVTRSRGRGKSTQLEVVHPGGKAYRDDAQKLIYERIGMEERDLFATCFFRQKELHRLVTMQPAPRQALIDEWIDLVPVQRAQARARADHEQALGSEREASSKLEVYREQEKEILDEFDHVREHAMQMEAWNSDIEKHIDRLREEAAKAKAEADQLERRAREELNAVHDQEDAEKLVELEKMLAGPSPGGPSESDLARVRKVVQKAAGDKAKAQQQEQGHALLLRTGFDGSCPVLPGFACPARDEINARRSEAKEAHSSASVAVRDAVQALGKAERQSVDLQRLQREVAADEARRAEIERQIEQLKPGAERHAARVGSSWVRTTVSTGEGHRRAAAAGAAVVAAEAKFDRLLKLQARISEEKQTLESVCARATTHREAAIILGKARRRIAEDAVAEIGVGANDRLRRIGVDLSVSVRWEREMKGLATACEACGAAYSSGRSQKLCARCGTARGPKLSEQLEVLLSDRSGAADDLGGAALAFSASAWLRASRGARWDVCCLDEPFGALDAAHRAAFGAHVATLLKADFRQAFVVAHQRDVVDALPARIQIIAGRNGSRFAT